MRIIAVVTTGIGGLADGRVELPPGAVTGLAGPNGTGKSKLLACMLAPWTGTLPSPRSEDTAAEVRVEIEFSISERSEMASFSQQMNWGEVEVPERAVAGVRYSKLTGSVRFSSPDSTVLSHLWQHEPFLSANPSLNVVFLPAERRLLEPQSGGIDLDLLSDAVAYYQGARSREAVSNYGRLDDQEFENYAKALCVAAALPVDDEETTTNDSNAVASWHDFRATVNSLIAPKELLGLSRAHPDSLRVKTPDGSTHGVRDLSSGERQALIIVSRVLSAATRTPLVLIDEPDAYLHPHLSKRLFSALERGVGPAGQLIVATHSPAILDGISPSAILRLGHGSLATGIADETDRIDLYREAGFRASALTQADLLVVTEGETDATLLALSIPELSQASVRAAGGKSQVLRDVEQLKPFSLPILGIVDQDVAGAQVPAAVAGDIVIWPKADIEGVYLGDINAQQTMIDAGLLKPSHRNLDAITEEIERLCEGQRDNVIAELVRSTAVSRTSFELPSPRGLDPIDRLRVAVLGSSPMTAQEFESAVADATSVWEAHSSDRLVLVRGKYILNAFTREASEMKSGRALLDAVARSGVTIPAVEDVAGLVRRRLGLIT